MSRLIAVAFLALLFLGDLLAADENLDADVLVYGATPAGIAAAVSAAKGGRAVMLVEPTDRIGGMMTSGLSHSDFRTFESLTGFFRDFANRVEAFYEAEYGPESEQVKACFRGTFGEPSVNLRVFEEILAEYDSIQVIKETSIESTVRSPLKHGQQRLLSASFRDGQTSVQYAAKVFIDCSYEGDLMAAAGEPYHVGRESRAQYGEPDAGNENGQGDGQVQGYNFRLIMTEVDDNKRMPSAPDGYRREDFVASLGAFKSGKLKRVFSDGHDGIYRAHLPLLPNGKADVNDTPNAPIRLSMPDINDDYPDGNTETRAAIVQQHHYYNIGLLYFLQNDDEVPKELRQDARRFGFCKDEFQTTGGVPPQLYIREARRLIGQHVFTANDTMFAKDDARSVLRIDSIAIGDYVHNCHGTGRLGTRYNGQHVGEFYKFIVPFQIPYGVIVPVKSQNLLVPVACSASHFGFGALRLEPTWCSLGQAAGWAAVESIHSDRAVQDLDVASLQTQLHADRSATIYVSDVAPNSEDFALVQWWASRGGLHGLAMPNQPKPKRIVSQYSEAFPGHAAELNAPLQSIVRDRWKSLQPELSTESPGQTTTRRTWIKSAFQTR